MSRQRRASLVARLLAASLAAWGAHAAAETAGEPRRDANMTLDETVISGNQELPKVLYIVPWQQPEGRPDLAVQSEPPGDALFKRMRPAAHQRELMYLETLQGTSPED